MGRCLFVRFEEEHWRSPFFKINFIGLNYEAGNETRENIWSEFVAEKRVVFCSYRCFLESEKLRREKNSVSEQKFVVRHFEAVLFLLRDLVMILF